MERLTRCTCPRIQFAVVGPIVNFADVLLPCLTFFAVVRTVFDDGFNFVLLQVVIILLAAIARIGNDGVWQFAEL